MPNYSKKIVYLSKAQYQELIVNNSVTVNGVTVTYNENDIYVTPQAEPITDVKINNVSIGSNGVANIPIATANNLGVVYANSTGGIGINPANGLLFMYFANDNQIKAGSDYYKNIVAGNQHTAVFYGLSKIAGVDLANETVTVGTYPNSSKDAIQNMLGISDLIAPRESSTATAAHAVDSVFLMDGKLYKATSEITVGDAVASGTNCTQVNISEVYATINDPVFTNSISLGRKSNTTIGIGSVAIGSNAEASGQSSFATGNSTVASGQHSKAEGYTAIASGSNSHAEGNGTIANGSNAHAEGKYNVAQTIISDWAANTHYNIGDKVYHIPTTYECIEENTDTTWTSAHWKQYGFTSEVALVIGNGTSNDARSNALTLNWNGDLHLDGEVYINANANGTGGTRVPHDVQINGTSIVSNGIATIPVRTNVVSDSTELVTSGGINNAFSAIFSTTSAQIKAGTHTSRIITPAKQHESVFYGLAKAAGDTTQSSSSNSVGIYTDGAKASIQNMLGITNLISTEESSTATAAHAINSTFMMNGKLHRATAAIAVGDAVVVGTNCEIVKADSIFVKNTDYATTSTAGIIKVGARLEINTNNELLVRLASENNVKTGASLSVVLTPARIDSAAFYGLSKAAGIDLASETVTLGTYPNTSKIAIRKMIDALGPNNISDGLALAEDTETGSWVVSTNVQDVQINGISIINNRVANIPIASDTNLGLVKTSIDYGIAINPSTGAIMTRSAGTSDIKNGTDWYRPITPYYQHNSVFYGLAKAAGDSTQVASDNAVGTYTSGAQTAIQTMLGAQAAIEVIRL